MKENCITFTTDDGEQVDFFVLEQTVLAGVSYLLVTDGSEEDDGNFLILKENPCVDDESMATFEIVENEKELEAVVKIFDELLEDVDLEV